MLDDREPGTLDAGDLHDWLGELRAALRGDGDTDVPCEGCTACCEASQFVHVAPDDVEALAHIPRPLLFPAPGGPEGHLVMGYDERGRCPMLTDTGCSIYEHRPRTCRTYDCRVFAATGIEPYGAAQAAVADRARRWRFAVRDAADEASLRAMHAEATRLGTDTDLPAIAVALAAIERANKGDHA
jgi:Fe-S-cluster containining protein